VLGLPSLADRIDAATPLPVDVRYDFVRAVAAVLATSPEIGPGLVHRVCVEVQRKFFVPPTMAAGTAGRTSKYR
jgi:hypothetical protein